MTTVGQALVVGLAARGVEVVFGIPGVHTIGLYRGLPGSGIRHVTPRHEQGAGFMADGYARVTGRPGVALVITGPGVTNTLTALAQARADSVPVLLVSAVNAQATLGQGLGFLHELPDQAGLVRTLCPTFRVTAPEALERCLSLAWVAMLAGRPGPAHLELPLDVLDMPAVPGGPAMAPTVAPTGPASLPGAALDAAAALLAGARHPVILAGGGARQKGPAVVRLAEALDAPVVMTVNARGLMAGHDLAVPASPSLAAVRALLAGADRVLVLGSELGPTDCDMYARGGFPDLSGMVRVDVSDAQLARHPCAVALCGDTGAVAAALADRLGSRTPGPGPLSAAAAREAAQAEVAGLHPGFALHLSILAAVRAAVPGARIVGDSTQPVYAGNLWFPGGFPGCWFNAATGFGALGYGPPAAIGAAIADPGRPVVCLVGDGGLQFAAAELRTARDEGVDVTFLVWNNHGYREIAEAMAAAGAGNTGCTPTPLDHGALAAACGLPFASIPADPAALADALCQPCTGPRMIELRAP